jgi:hypothetical protein
MASFKVPCPSCEAEVLIKNPNLIGTKVECPKCKYRFKVEEPTAKAGDKKGGTKEKKALAPPAKGKNKKLVPILVGVVAVVVLVVGVVAFAGGGKKKGSSGPGPGASSKGSGGSGEGTENAEPKPPEPVGPTVAPVPLSKANTTHLLHGDAVAVYRFNVDRIADTPAYATLADSAVRGLFRDAMGFETGDVETYIHCVAGAAREPFGVIRLKNPTKPADLAAALARAKLGKLDPKPTPVNNKRYSLYAVASNPFVGAVSQALAMRSLFGEVYDRVPTAVPAAAAAKPTGVCVYDTQHILIGDHALLKQFLESLDADGYPPFKTVMAPQAPKDAPAPKDGMPPATPAPAPAPAPAPTGGDKPFTGTDTYRTVENPLKLALDVMEADRTATPLLVYAEKFDRAEYDPKQMKKEYQALSEALTPITTRTVFLSGNVVVFNERQLVANLRILLQKKEDAQEIAKNQLGPGLAITAELLKLLLGLPVEFRDYTNGGLQSLPNTGPGGTGTPAGPGTGFPMGPAGSGFPMGPPGPRPGRGEGSEGPGVPMPGTPMQPGTGDPNTAPPPVVSHIDLGMTDQTLVIAVDLTWNDTAYRTVVAPRLISLTNQIKGKMAVFASEFSWHALAAAGPKASVTPKPGSSDPPMYPRGAASRAANADRFGLEYPPTSRVSLFAELLPHLGRGELYQQLKPGAAWHDKENLPAPGRDRAGAWVPELLVPDYPQSAWRAVLPPADNYVLGATNYVAVAGRGVNVARELPDAPGFPKTKVGITGYGWGSKPSEVTDGLSNTVYLMQTPPGLQQPWIAGGGATVRGLDETDPMGAFKYPQRGRTKPGSYALMADGSVRFVPFDIDPKVLLAMATRAGGDNDALADLDKVAPKMAPPEPKKEDEPAPAPKAEPKKDEPKKEPEAKKDDPKTDPEPKKDATPEKK